MKILILLFSVFLFIIPLSAPAHSEVLYSTFGPGQSFDNTENSGWVIGSGSSYNQQIAAPFILSFNVILDSIDFATDYDWGPNQVSVNLVYGDSGLPSTDPEKVIESFNFTNLSELPTIYRANSLLKPLLEGSTQYWVVLKADNSTTKLQWKWNNNGMTGLAFCNPPVGTPWIYYLDKTPAFDIKGSTAVIDSLGIYIDIIPDSNPNSINPRSMGAIPVAILTTEDFDATVVDPSTVLFGKTGIEASPFHYAFEDVDGDGDIDMILHFRTQETGLVCENTEAILTGETLDGQAIEGSDSIKTVGCKKSTFTHVIDHGKR